MEKLNEVGKSVLTSIQQFDFWWQLLALATALLLATLANQRLQALV